MAALTALYLAQPFWVWMAFAALLLAAEMATGTGYLLWPAGSAAVIGFVQLALRPGLPIDVLAFAILTIASTILGRRYLPAGVRQHGPNINDRGGRLVGRQGEITGAFTAGRGRVFVDGAEWTAEIDPGAEPPPPGARVEVTAVNDGRLSVRPADAAAI